MTLEQKVQWLMDRTAISELLLSFAQALDCKDYQRYADNYADGGYIELPDPMVPGAMFKLNKQDMPLRVAASIGRYTATHHISANHQIQISGDSAHSRSYLQAVHVSGEPTDHWSAGGWYDCDYVRAPSGWKFTRVRLVPVWMAGKIREIKPD